jgi:predicted TIM-barrel fold metal-dependent hydrolase
MSPSPRPIIDAHVHLGDDGHLRLDPRALTQRMDDHGVSIAIARPTGAELAVHNTAGNDRVLNAGPRVRALVTANPWYGTAALDELRRCQPHHPAGLYLHPSRQGFCPTDAVAAPLIHFARSVSWPVVIHTGTYIQSDVLAVAELARRFPDLTFVCDAAGFSDMWFELPVLLDDVPNLMIGASLIWGRAVAGTVSRGAARRILFGSGEPRDTLAASLARIRRLALDATDLHAILFDNARRVFRLDGVPGGPDMKTPTRPAAHSEPPTPPGTGGAP